jgi:tetratricopeptide (TPR) repeat protein
MHKWVYFTFFFYFCYRMKRCLIVGLFFWGALNVAYAQNNASQDFRNFQNVIGRLVKNNEWKKADSLIALVRKMFEGGKAWRRLLQNYERKKEERIRWIDPIAANRYNRRNIIGAAPLYKELTELEPTNLLYYLRYASCLEALQQTSQAIAIYETLFSLFPDFSDTLQFNYVQLLKKEEKYTKALEILTQLKKKTILPSIYIKTLLI